MLSSLQTFKGEKSNCAIIPKATEMGQQHKAERCGKGYSVVALLHAKKPLQDYWEIAPYCSHFGNSIFCDGKARIAKR